MKPRGRPTILSAQIQDRIVKSIELGVPRDDAFLCAGIAKETGYKWLAWGREGRPEYIDFALAIEAADAACIEKCLVTIAGHARKDWKAGAWIAERKRPAQFARQVKVTLESEQNEFLNKLEAALPPEDFQRILDVVTARGTETSEAVAAAGALAGEDDGTDPEGTPDAG